MAAGGKTVLVVEDSPDYRWLSTLQLRQEGYCTACAEDGVEALDYLHTHAAPDVILLDLRMPRMNGWQFLAEKERDPTLANIPVVIYSAEAHAFSERGLTPSVVGCVLKSGKREDLVRVVRSATLWRH